MVNVRTVVPFAIATMRTAAVYCITCNLYSSGQLVRLVQKVVMQNNKKFMEVILHAVFTGRQANSIYSFQDFLFLHE